MLGTEGGAEPNIRQSGKRVQRMGEVGCHSCRMGQQSHTATLQATPQPGVFEQAIDLAHTTGARLFELRAATGLAEGLSVPRQS